MITLQSFFRKMCQLCLKYQVHIWLHVHALQKGEEKGCFCLRLLFGPGTDELHAFVSRDCA